MRRAAAFVLLCGVVGGCGAEVPEAVRRVEAADTLIVYSLDCGRDCGRDGPPAGAETLHGYAVLGKVTVPPDRRAAVAAAVRESMVNPDGGPAKCIWPRHAVRAVRDGAVTADLLVCYQCQTYDYRPAGGAAAGLTPAFGRQSKPVLNDLLTAAGVPLCPENGTQ